MAKPVNVLVLNAGSGTVKAARFVDPAGTLGHPRSPDWSATEPAAGGRHADAANQLLTDVTADIDVVGHRIVHGGPAILEPTVITGEVRRALNAAATLAPIHGPAALAILDQAHEVLPQAIHVAVPDTGFHRNMPSAAAAYAGPYAWFETGLRRYGFHGLAHEYAAHRAAAVLDRPINDLRIVSCHLGGGCSIAAIDSGHSIDTTMGYTPLDGLPMATRSGTIDPGLLLHLLRTGVSVDELDELLNLHSGLLGLSGRTADLAEAIDCADAGDQRARLAVDVYFHRLRAGVGAMLANLNGLDAIVLSGGAAEGVPEIHDALRELLHAWRLDAPLLVEDAREDWSIALAAAAAAKQDRQQ